VTTPRIPIIGISGGDGTVGADLLLGEHIGRSIARRRLECALLSGGEPSNRPRIQDAPLTGLVDEAAKQAAPAIYIAIPRHDGEAVPPALDTRYAPPIRGLIFRDSNKYADGTDCSRRNMLVAAIPDVLLIFKGGLGGGTLSECAMALSLGRPVVFVNSFKELARMIGVMPAATETITKTVTQTETETQTSTGGELVESDTQTQAGQLQTQTAILVGAGTQTETQTQTASETITKTVAACRQHIGEHFDVSHADAVFEGLKSVLSSRLDYERSSLVDLPERELAANVDLIADFIVDLALGMVDLNGQTGEYPAGLSKSGLNVHKSAFDDSLVSLLAP
jgi:hypothetical protein